MTDFNAFKQLTEKLEEIKFSCENCVSQSVGKKLRIGLEDMQLL